MNELTVDRAATGERMYRLISAAFPICRSITGDGFRRTLELVRDTVPLVVQEVPTGTQVFDWTVPKEWNIRDAYIADASGRRVVDFRASNLHVVSYSTPVRRRLRLAELRPHLFSLPDRPDVVPYRTAYYSETWGFCLSHRQLESLVEGEYEVSIDSTLAPGHLTYGEYAVPGTERDEILISCHCCHPSLANDNLSGMALATLLAEELSRVRPRYSYRFLFLPGTIGAITWLARNQEQVGRIRGGLVITCVGDPGGLTYKQSRRGDGPVDRAARHVLKHWGGPCEVLPFEPYGYDERQYCSPGFNLAVGCLMRSPYGRFPEYHTSADNLSFVRPEHLGDSYAAVMAILRVVEGDRRYLNTNPRCEPQLGRRGLYSQIGGDSESRAAQLAMLWVLNYSDGHHSLLDIAELAGAEFGEIAAAAARLTAGSLLSEISDSG